VDVADPNATISEERADSQQTNRHSGCHSNHNVDSSRDELREDLMVP
jgi:hypothetical protein